MSDVARDENKIYQVLYGKDGWIWARFDIKLWQYLAYADLDDAILCQHPDNGISSNWLYQVITKGDLVIGCVTMPC